MMSKKSKPVKKDYLIFAPPYSGSAGIRVMHLLAHHLNNRGYSAFIPTTIIDKGLNNLCIKNREELWRLSYHWRKYPPVVVYPEIVTGNPAGMKHIVRYILNKPGFIGGDMVYPKEDILFAYNKYCQGFLPENTPILEIPCIDQTLFNDKDTGARAGRLVWVYKGFNTPKVKETEGAREITLGNPETRPELAELLRTSEVLYSYDMNSSLSTEARLCGCPVVIIPEPSTNLTKDDILFTSPNGLAWGTSKDELEYAKKTVHLFTADYNKRFEGWESQLDNFIAITQGGVYG